MAGAAALVLSASPRAGGNCDAASRIVTRVLEERGLAVSTLALRDHAVLPCVACGHCSRHPGADCPRQAADGSGPLLAALGSAPLFVLAAPVYFYHLPAQLKALIDRAQPLWTAREAGRPPVPGPRPGGIILAAARSRGEKLFEGSLLTIRLWLDLYGIRPAPPLTLYGLDGPRALASDPGSTAAVREYALGLPAPAGAEPPAPAPRQ